jgi:zinc transporter ZupT
VHGTLAMLLALLAGLGNVLGGAVIATRPLRSGRLLRFVALGGGFLMAAALLDMLPSALAAGSALGPASVIAGYLVILVLENLVTAHAHRYDRVGEQLTAMPAHAHAHRHEHHRTVHPHLAEPGQPELAIGGHTALSVLLGMVVHTFFDGVSIAAGFLAGGLTLGLLMFEAVIVHNAGDGFSVSAVTLAASGSRPRALAAAVIIGVSTIAGALLTLAVGQLSSQTTDVLLGFAAGTFLYIALTDLVPAVNESHDRPALGYVLVGVALFAASAAALARAGLG